MNIGLDGRALIGSRTGIGRYVYEICHALDGLLPDATFYVYSHRPLGTQLPSARWHMRLDASSLAKRLPGVPWLKLRAGRLVVKDRLDVFWATTAFLPSLPPTVRTVATVYDLNVRVVPRTMSMLHRWSHRVFLRRDLSRADRICPISHGTAARIESAFGLESFAIVPPAVSGLFRPPDDGMMAQILAKHQLRPPFFLSVATREPRKNLRSLVRAFLTLKADGTLADHQLVLVGGAGWGRPARMKDLGPATAIRLLGFVADDDLPSLYGACEAFVFPSLYEGFGIPVLEARACGAPVIATDIPELREAGGVDTVYVAPTPAAIQAALAAVIASPPPRNLLMTPGSWHTSATLLADALSGLVESDCRHRQCPKAAAFRASPGHGIGVAR